MVRPGLVLAGLIAAATAHASESPRAVGLYPPSGAPLAMLDSKVEVAVRGPIAEVVVTQRFQNRADHATEATYIFPLPADAAVTAMSIRTGALTIHAAIERREDAQRRYEAAVRAGAAGAVLDQERPDVFTQTVAAIPAKGTVDIVLRYDTLARYESGAWGLALPMVVAPRYVPGTATSRPTTGTGRAPDTDRAPDASRVTPGGGPSAGGATEVAIHFADKVVDPTSPTHELRVLGATDVAFTDPRTDHDAIVRWRSTAPAGGWVEAAHDGGYAAVLVEAPPPAARKGPVRFVIALDRSAASRGDAESVARPFVRALLGALGSADRVAVIGSDSIAWSAPGDAARVLDQNWQSPAGAFDLTRVLAGARSGGAPIVVISGGLVADDHAAIAAAKKLGVPLHVVGVGPAPARGLLGQLAGASGGTVRFAIPGDDVGALAKAVVADASTPPTPLAVTWGTLTASDVVPGILPRLGAGQAMLVLARVQRAQPANARAGGALFAIETVTVPRAADGATTALGPLGRRWARNRLDELLGNRAAATAHALRHGLVSPYTSLVAIGEVVVEGGVKRSVAVPVSVPAGMKWDAVKRETTVDLSSAGDKTATLDRAPTAGAAEQPPARPDQPKPPSAAKRPRPKVDRKSDEDEEHPAKKGKKKYAAEPKAEPKQAPKANDELEKPGEPDYDAEGGDIDVRQNAPAPTVSTLDTASGESIELSSAPRRAGGLRITAGLGGGLAIASGARTSLLAVSARLELGDRTLVGFGGSLWLVDASDVQGQLMASFARVGFLARRLELGLGAGLQLGNGFGPAGAVGLRYHLPATRAAGYLRYDAALLRDADTSHGQHAITLGAEYAF